LPPSIHHETAFYNFLGKLIVLTPLGKWFNYLFPMVILVPVCATLFNLYGRVKDLFGFGVVEDEEEDDNAAGFGTGSWRDGRDLIERELHGGSALDASTPLDQSLPAPPRGPRRAPTSTAASRATPTPAPTAPPPERIEGSQRQAEHPHAATQAAEEEDESVFSGFAHRFRNTIEAVERPKWLPDLSKRPKWMRGTDGNTGSSGQAGPGRGLGRWFGGRPADGQIRL
jgi:hypothetical protein